MTPEKKNHKMIYCDYPVNKLQSTFNQVGYKNRYFLIASIEQIIGKVGFGDMTEVCMVLQCNNYIDK